MFFRREAVFQLYLCGSLLLLCGSLRLLRQYCGEHLCDWALANRCKFAESIWYFFFPDSKGSALPAPPSCVPPSPSCLEMQPNKERPHRLQIWSNDGCFNVIQTVTTLFLRKCKVYPFDVKKYWESPIWKKNGQNSNPCTGSLILGSLILGSSVWGSSVLGLRNLGPWFLVWGSLVLRSSVLGLRILNPRTEDPHSPGP